MATILEGAIQSIILQDINPGIDDSLDKLDPVWTDVVQSSMGVVKTNIGRGWLSISTFGVGRTGGGYYTKGLGSDETSGLNLVKQYGTPATFPSIAEHTHGDLVQTEVRLVRYKGTFILPLVVLRANELDSAVADMVSYYTAGCSRRVAQDKCLSFYSEDATNVKNVLCTVPASITAGSGADSYVTFIVSASARGRTFYPGQFVEIWKSDGLVRRHQDGAALNASGAKLAIVDSFDPLGGSVTIRLSTGNFDTAVEVGDVVIPMQDTSRSGVDVTNAARKPTAPYGVLDWTINSGTLFEEESTNGVSLATYGQFKSIVDDLGGSVLSEELLNQYFGRFFDAYGGTVDLDTIVTTQGVINGFMTGQDGQYTFERNNAVLKNRVGWSQFEYVCAGRVLKVVTSPYLKPGYCLGLKLGEGNIRELTPPDLPGSSRDARMAGQVEFVMTSMGSNSIFTAARAANGAIAEFVEAPFEFFHQYQPKWPQGIKLTGAAEVI